MLVLYISLAELEKGKVSQSTKKLIHQDFDGKRDYCGMKFLLMFFMEKSMAVESESA